MDVGREKISLTPRELSILQPPGKNPFPIEEAVYLYHHALEMQEQYEKPGNVPEDVDLIRYLASELFDLCRQNNAEDQIPDCDAFQPLCPALSDKPIEFRKAFRRHSSYGM